MSILTLASESYAKILNRSSPSTVIKYSRKWCDKVEVSLGSNYIATLCRIAALNQTNKSTLKRKECVIFLNLQDCI